MGAAGVPGVESGGANLAVFGGAGAGWVHPSAGSISPSQDEAQSKGVVGDLSGFAVRRGGLRAVFPLHPSGVLAARAVLPTPRLLPIHHPTLAGGNFSPGHKIGSPDCRWRSLPIWKPSETA